MDCTITISYYEIRLSVSIFFSFFQVTNYKWGNEKVFLFFFYNCLLIKRFSNQVIVYEEVIYFIMAKLEKAMNWNMQMWFSCNFHVLALPKSATKFFVYLHSKLSYLRGSHSLRAARILRHCTAVPHHLIINHILNIVMARLRTQLIHNQAFTKENKKNQWIRFKKNRLTLLDLTHEQLVHPGMDMVCIPSIFIKTSQIFFWWKLFDFSFHQNFFWEVEDAKSRP